MLERDGHGIPVMRPEDRGVALLCHFFTMVPLWALVANGLLYFHYRESSRAICFHARQGINFQILFLAVSIPLLSAYLLSDLMGIVLAPLLAEPLVIRICLLLDQFISLTLVLLAAGYILCCLIGFIQALKGRVFPYPFVGKRAFQRYIRIMTQGAAATETATPNAKTSSPSGDDL